MCTMNTRGRKKQSGTSRVPVNPTEGPAVSTEAESIPAAKKSTGGRTKVPATRKSRVVATPVKKRVPIKKKLTVRGSKTRATPVSNPGSEDSQVVEDQDLLITESESEDESRLEIERLRMKLVELEADQGSQNLLKAKRL